MRVLSLALAFIVLLCTAAVHSSDRCRQHAQRLAYFHDGASHVVERAQAISGGLSNRNCRLQSSSGEVFIMRVPGDLLLPAQHNYSRVHLVNR